MRVLLVDDHGRQGEVLRERLRREPVEVHVARDGEQALELARADGYDVIVLAPLSPMAKRCQMCRRITRGGIATPILMVTAPGAAEEKAAALLRERTGPAESSAEILQVGDLVVNRLTHEVWRAGQLLPLTPTEFDVLECLMEHAGRVLGHPAIAKKVWGQVPDPPSNVVEVYIERLRRKIDRDFSPPLIQTFRGMGYVLRAPLIRVQPTRPFV